MPRIGRFERVSPARFQQDWEKAFATPAPDVQAIALPRRATRGSAGYDFFSPADFTLAAGEGILLPTGIRALMDEGWLLALFPRSGLGFKYRFQLDNSVGIIDSDYALSDNEGHIMLKLTNDGREGKPLTVAAGSAVAQGIFLPYGITFDDDAQAQRNGGFGSTDGKPGR